MFNPYSAHAVKPPRTGGAIARESWNVFSAPGFIVFFTFNADATQLIVNGGFETGSFSGWAVSNQAGSFAGSNFFVSNSTTVPLAGVTTVGPASGSFYAVSDQSGGGTHALTQVFTVPGPASSVIL